MVRFVLTAEVPGRSAHRGTNYSKGHYFNQTGGFLFVSNRFDTRYVDNAAAIQALTSSWQTPKTTTAASWSWTTPTVRT